MREVSSAETQSVCMCLHCGEVWTHPYIVLGGSCLKCELRNWEDVPGDNLWSDSAMGDSWSHGWRVGRGGGGGVEYITEG